jgi:hypothetical protein
MGFSPFLGLLPGGDAWRYGLHSLKLKGRPVNIDAAGLMWQCAFKTKAEYLDGNIAPAAKLFQNSAVFIFFVLEWNACFIFDGADPEEKKHEHARRSRGEEPPVDGQEPT